MFFKALEKIKNKPAGKKKNKSCRLYKTCKTPYMKPSGKGRKKVLVIAQAPGKIEDEKGSQFKGKAGQLLRRKLDHLGIDLDLDCWKDNAIRCRPPNNRAPSNSEIKECRPKILQTIKELQPEKILLFGKEAVQSVVGERVSVTSIGKWVGWKIPDQQIKAWIYPNYHPSYLLRDSDNKALDKIFSIYLKQAIQHDIPFPDYGDEQQKIKIINSEEEAIHYLNTIIQEKPIIAFDYETTGIKSHRQGHRIVCMSIAISGERAFSFLIYDSSVFRKTLKRVLYSTQIKKVVQNLKFECSWTINILGYPVRGWLFGTMIASHFLDNRQGITGLKFQTYVNYGTVGYDDLVKRYITSTDEKSANSFNQIDKASVPKLLLYCGMDSMFTFRLFIDQQKKIKAFDGYGLFQEGMIEFCDIEQNGICVDIDYFRVQEKHLERKIKRIQGKIQNSELVEKWNDKVGTIFNPQSDPQLKKLLFGVCGYKTKNTTKKGNPSTDQETLEKLNIPFTRDVVQLRKLKKLKDTYVTGFINEEVYGKVHPSFNLNTVKTYRSSCSNPNIQNIPKRDKEAQKIVRTGIKPSPGNQLLEVDYKGMEVCTAACISQDSELIKYVTDPSTDMHRDVAMVLFDLTKEQVTKDIRFQGKSGFTFAEFYGDYYANCAKSIWSNVGELKTTQGQLLKEHLESRGISNYRKFEKKVEQVEDWFWNEKFVGYRDWKKSIWKQYQRDGYIDLITGFKCQGLMGKNDVSNYPIQGPAFHCLLWSLISLNRKLKTWKSEIKEETHDSILFDVCPNELAEIIPMIRQVMCEDVREHWSWIVVPLNVDAEISEIDGNWFEMKGIEIEI